MVAAKCAKCGRLLNIVGRRGGAEVSCADKSVRAEYQVPDGMFEKKKKSLSLLMKTILEVQNDKEKD